MHPALLGGASQRIAPVPAFLDARKLVMPTTAVPVTPTVAGPGLTNWCSRYYTRWYAKTPLWFQVVYWLGGLKNDQNDPNVLGEFLPANDIDVAGSVQNNANSNWVKQTFNGSPTFHYIAASQNQQIDPVTGLLLPPGLVKSDKIFVSNAAVGDGSGGLGFSTSAVNGVVKIKSRFKLASDAYAVQTSLLTGDTQDQFYRMSDANEADQVWSIGDFVSGVGDVTNLITIGPSAIIGAYKNNDGLTAFMTFGDSIGQYFNDNRFGIRTHAAGAPNGGMFNSAARTIGVPLANLCLASSSPIGYTGDTRVRDHLRRHAHVVIEEGAHNAFSASSASADVFSWVKSANVVSKQSGVLHTAICNVIADATSSNHYAAADGSDQAPRQDFEPGGKAPTYNSLIAAAAGRWDFYDTLLDNESQVGLAANKRLWKSIDVVSETSPAGIHLTGTAVVGTQGGGHRICRDNVIIPYMQSIPTPAFTTP